jgi:PAS domain S-box-containing protein
MFPKGSDMLLLKNGDSAIDKIIQCSPIPQFAIDRDHRVISWNRALEEFSGIRARDIVGTSQHWRAFYDAERPCLADILVDGATGKLPGWYQGKYSKSRFVDGGYETTIFFPSKGNEGKWLSITAAAIRDPNGETIGAVETLEDITECKLAEKSLRENNEKFSVLFENARDAIFLHGTSAQGLPGQIVEANECACRMLKYNRDELLERSPTDLVPPELLGKALKDLENLPAAGHGTFEWMLVTRDGGKIPVEISAHLFDLKGQNHVFCVARDISERRRLEERLRKFSEDLENGIRERTEHLVKSLHENEMLMKEVHHRVRNNFRIVSSLLPLQSGYIKDEATTKAILESQNRVKAMALVHEKVYGSTDIAKVDLSEYVRFLSTGLFRFYDVNPRRISLNIDIQDVSAGSNIAIPLSLIMNELVSNSLKHAFPDGRTGRIEITCYRDDHSITLIVSDDGIGFPDDLDFRNTDSLGLRIVVSQVEQLNGTIELDRKEGTAFRITFKEKDD